MLSYFFIGLIVALLLLIFLLVAQISESLRHIGELFADILIGAPDVQAIDCEAGRDENADDIEQYFEKAIEPILRDEADWRQKIFSS